MRLVRSGALALHALYRDARRAHARLFTDPTPPHRNFPTAVPSAVPVARLSPLSTHPTILITTNNVLAPQG